MIAFTVATSERPMQTDAGPIVSSCWRAFDAESPSILRSWSEKAPGPSKVAKGDRSKLPKISSATISIGALEASAAIGAAVGPAVPSLFVLGVTLLLLSAVTLALAMPADSAETEVVALGSVAGAAVEPTA
jgi:hypothetical protein